MSKRPKQNSDHAQRHNTPTIDNQAIANHLEALLTPAIFAQQKYYKQLGLRDRILNLSLMVAAVLTLLWRRVPGVQELNRLLAREDLLWAVAKADQSGLGRSGWIRDQTVSPAVVVCSPLHVADSPKSALSTLAGPPHSSAVPLLYVLAWVSLLEIGLALIVFS